VLRALGCDLPGLTTATRERRPVRPGQHGAQRQKLSDYGVRLKEKQKLRFNYGLSERGLRALMIQARRASGSPGDKLLELLERRLDNVLFRAGFAATIPAARQLITHGHATLNGRRVTVPSIRVREGDVVSLRERSRDNPHVKDALSASTHRPDWLAFDDATMLARVVATPSHASVPFEVDSRLVVEFYANRL
jgi:small subunit ribosomal protein S4